MLTIKKKYVDKTVEKKVPKSRIQIDGDCTQTNEHFGIGTKSSARMEDFAVSPFISSINSHRIRLHHVKDDETQSPC